MLRLVLRDLSAASACARCGTGIIRIFLLGVGVDVLCALRNDGRDRLNVAIGLTDFLAVGPVVSIRTFGLTDRLNLRGNYVRVDGEHDATLADGRTLPDFL